MITQENIPYTADEIKAMVKTCEKYHQALEKARELMNKGYDVLMPEIFPELEESEDEKMRKMCMRYLDWEYQHCYFNEDKMKIEKCIAWLEKQGETDPSIGCTNDKGRVTCENGNMKETKAEPKFHPGDWIVDNIGNIFQIERVFETIAKDIFGYITVGGVYFNDNNDVRLWTIQDAKDGDALCTYECDEPKTVFILKGAPKKGYALSYHCYYNIMYPYFVSDSENGCLAPKDENVKPATKEQRDLLFQKMKEAGYEWDSDKKELKNMKVASEDERIRAGIIALLKFGLEDGSAIAPGFNETKEQALAWLEKQGEKKSVEEVLKIRQELYQSGYNDGYKHGQEDMAKSLEKKSGDEELKGITQWMPTPEPPQEGGDK